MAEVYDVTRDVLVEDLVFTAINKENGITIEVPFCYLYPYEGGYVFIDGEKVEGKRSLKLKGDVDFLIKTEDSPSRLLVLEAEPLNEPIINDGPMIMNTQEEILQGYRDYWENQYGGWPWDERDPMHDVGTGRVSSRGENPKE